MNHWPKCKAHYHKIPLDNIRGKNIDDLGYGDDFLDTKSKAQSIKKIIDKLNFLKIKNVYSAKDNVKDMRR